MIFEFFPYNIQRMSNGANCAFKRDDIWKIASVDVFDGFYYFINEGFLFLAVLDYCKLFGLNVFFDDRYSNCKWGVIRCQTPVRMDKMVVNFFWPES